jgi:arylsulfatase A-like enzyme
MIMVSCAGDESSYSDGKILKPNVLLIMTDDQGYGDMSCHGNPFIQTPGIDRLHGESCRFTDFHVDPTCAPTRSALMTGKYSSRTGVWHTLQGRSIMNRDETTLAEVFRDNGYITGLIGKWHLGDNYPYRPGDRGFMDVLQFTGATVGQNPDFWRNDYFDDIYYHNGKYEFFEGYHSDVFFGYATKFIEEKHPDKTGKPFFCYLATNAPHFWYYVENDYTIEFREMGMPDQLSRYLGMIANLDENLGRLMAKLVELGLRENTIVVFMTDNGQSNYAIPREGEEFHYNAGMRAQKGSHYEGGHRVPLFIRWPGGRIPQGRDIENLTGVFDVMPTLIDLCGLANVPAIDFDGRSLVPLMKDGEPEWQDRTLFVHNQRVEIPVKWRNCAVMTEKYRLINGKELYDIGDDPGQKVDIAVENPDVVEQLRTEYAKWWEHISDGFDDYSRLYIGHPDDNPTHLNCHDWHSEEPLRVWDQEVIRNRKHKNGFWALEVVQDGEYEFTCRTYPRQQDTWLRVVRLKFVIGDRVIDKDCDPMQSEVKLRVYLEAGKTELQTWFYEQDGNSYGVPFVYVEKI